MPRATPTEDLELIESIIAGHPGGIRISDIASDMARRQGASPNRRTLQRRLQKLIDAQCVTTEGESVALVYKPALGAGGQAIGTATATSIAQAELYVPVSPEGATIRDQVRRAPMHRRPVGYQRDFLQAYQPGETFYLPEALRHQLHEMGRTSAKGVAAFLLGWSGHPFARPCD